MYRAFLNFGGPAAIFLSMMVQPKSIGELRLKSANPSDQPVINPNYLADETDIQILADGLKKIRELAATNAFADTLDFEIAPGPDTPLDTYIRTQAVTIWHPAGTCKMGTDAQAVVDPQLKVRGVEGLRVADASVMPTLVTGNIGAACFMIGEKAADLVMSRF
jgi:choline dehydrogenase